MAGTVEIERRDGGALARLTGKVDHELVESLRSKLPGSDAPDAALVVELAGVDYVSSSGLAALARLSTLGDVRFAALPGAVRDVVGLAGLDRILSIFDDVGAALAAPGRRRA